MVCRSSRGITVRDPRDPSADNRTVGGTGDGAAETAIHRTKSADETFTQSTGGQRSSFTRH
jgi:hypothetical protein